jgi:mono/diheme cytochrome c family protein
MKRFGMIWMAGMIAVFMLSFAATRLSAQVWMVPDDQKGELATFKFTDEVVKKGAEIFSKNCQSCHGIPTKANWAKIQPEPGDPASEKFSKNSDGELFYKITNGRGPMPQFRNILSEEDRWNVIAYLRSFHKGYVQPDPGKAKAAAKGGRATISMSYDTAGGNVIFQVLHTKDNVTSPAARAGILVFVKRYFGNLQVGAVKTNDKGFATYEFPKEITGDSIGMVAVLARLDEASGYGSAETLDSLPAGKPVRWVPLTEPRAMWNVRSKAPVWLMLTFSLTVIGVFVILCYIMMQIRKIHHSGREIDRGPDEPVMK